jgi:hypothetical protein
MDLLEFEGEFDPPDASQRPRAIELLARLPSPDELLRKRYADELRARISSLAVRASEAALLAQDREAEGRLLETAWAANGLPERHRRRLAECLLRAGRRDFRALTFYIETLSQIPSGPGRGAMLRLLQDPEGLDPGEAATLRAQAAAFGVALEGSRAPTRTTSRKERSVKHARVGRRSEPPPRHASWREDG